MDSSPRHVCITGCSRGLGLAMVHGFIRNGWRVSGCARSTAAIESLTKE